MFNRSDAVSQGRKIGGTERPGENLLGLGQKTSGQCCRRGS